jgi:Protein of unknown function (DUF2628)
MSVYTVHEPPPGRRGSESDPLRIAFVRDGFSFWAFLLGPLWMLWHRLWLALLGYVVAVIVLRVALVQLGAPASARALVGVLVALLVGLEGASLRRWTFRRRGWKQLGVVVADDRDLAERRFFDAWLGGVASAPPPVPAPPPARMSTNPPGDVLGLFPQPGARA